MSAIAPCPTGDRYLRRRQILEIFPVSAARWHQLVNQGVMPKPVLQIGKRKDGRSNCTFWLESEVRAGIEKLIAEQPTSAASAG